jgi:two-component system, OmpR family, phosphate regulon sensor histidine kinase PhoR
LTKPNPFAVLATCYGAAAILAVLAVFSYVAPNADSNVTIAFGVGSVVAAASGFYWRMLLREHRRAVDLEHSRLELVNLQLQRQSKAVDVLADGLEIAIFICDPKANVLYANRRAQEMFRFPNAAGRPILSVTLSHELENLVTTCHRTSEKQAAELSFTYPRENVALAEAWPEPGGERIFLSLYEITDLRRLERVRRDFVANVSHELRTPLTTIRAMAETLCEVEQEDVELSNRFLAKIVAEVDRLSLIADDLLILSASESNPVRKHACDLADVVHYVVQQLEQKAIAKGLALFYEGPKELFIEANSSQMTQVVMNLVDNAINYTVHGEIRVKLEDLGNRVILQVQDTGIGISSEHIPRLFERFYRVDKGRSRGTGGTGLGLSIVKHIVEAHGGTVTVESMLNQGSTFTVKLPVGDTGMAKISEA